MQPHYGHLVRILHWCTDQAITNALDKMELTSAQGHVMGYLTHCPQPPCPRDLEEAFHLSHATVSGILSRLEQKGFVTMLPDPSDRRCKRIHILPRGIGCRELMHQTIRETESRMVHGFSEAERTEFQALLERAINNMGHTPCQSKAKEDN